MLTQQDLDYYKNKVLSEAISQPTRFEITKTYYKEKHKSIEEIAKMYNRTTRGITTAMMGTIFEIRRYLRTYNITEKEIDEVLKEIF